MDICCQNIRALLDKVDGGRPERSSAIVARKLARYDIDIAALSESRLAGEGDCKEVGGTQVVVGYSFCF